MKEYNLVVNKFLKSKFQYLEIKFGQRFRFEGEIIDDGKKIICTYLTF